MQRLFHPNLFFTLLITGFVLVSCKKEKLADAIANSNPCNCPGNSLNFFTVSIKRMNNHAAGSQLVVEKFSHPNSDSSTIFKYSFLKQNLPFNDTVITQAEIKNYSLFFKWKVLNANNDSLSGGITPKLSTAGNTIRFEIMY